MADKFPTEYQEQVALASWLDSLGVVWCHVPNEGIRDRRTGAKLRRVGLKRGVPDVLVFSPPTYGTHTGAAIELKRRDRGEATSAQREWLDKLSELGWATIVAHGAREAVDWLISIGYESK